MKTISKFFKEFDFFSAPVSLRINDEPQMKSFPIGVASFIISLLFVYIFISTFVSTAKYQSITSQLQETVLPENATNGKVEAIAISVDQLDYQEMISMFILFYYTFTDGNYSGDYVRMHPCQPQLWSALGDGYVKQFYQYKLDKMVCVNTSFPFQIKQLRQTPNSSNIGIQLVICTFYSFGPSEICNQTKATEYILRNTPKISVYILDTGLNPDQKDSVKPFINMDAKFYISGEISSKLDIQFSSYRIQTDTSLLPYQQIQVVQGIKVGNIRNSIKQYAADATFSFVGSITISMNQNQQIYQRQIGKVDQLLSYVGGLFGILISIIAFFLSKFNEYRYQLKVAEKIFSYRNNDHKIMESDFNLFTYVKYSLYDWIKTLFCFEINWEQCKKIDQVRDQVNAHMQVNRFYKRIQNAETALIYIMGQDKADLIKIQEPTLFQNVQQRKLKLDYYGKITKKQQIRTVADVVTAEQALHSFFKDLLSKETEKMDQRLREQNIGNISRIIRDSQQSENPELKNLRFSKELKQKSQSLKLPAQYAKIEQNLSKSLHALSPERARQLLRDLPILIAYRLISKRTQDILNSPSK